MRTHWLIVFVLLLPGLLLEGCICETTGVNRGDINLVPLGEEWEMGDQLAQEIRQQATIVDDQVVQSYVEQMGERIVAQTELSDREWQFHVLADSSVNAFNIPGGHVFVNTGLIEAASSPAELAGVMAHEVAHGVARHSTERLTAAYGLNVIARLVMGEEVGLLEQIAAELLGTGAMAKFSRDDEREADRLGLQYLAETGYDPSGMASMFETMLALRERRPNIVELFFSTHPLTEERIQTVSELAATMSGGGAGDPAAFQRAQKRAAQVGR